jgi:signal transduction histidine kinase
MMGVIPGRVDQRGVRLAGSIFSGIGLLALAGCTLWVAAYDRGDSGSWLITLAFAAFAAAWLPLLILLFPHKEKHPWLTIGYYAVVLAAAAALISRSDAFTAFASIGYPIAFALFSARWSVFAVTATAVVPLFVRGGFEPDAHTPAWVLVFSVAGPLLYAAWFVGLESEKRRKVIGALAETNEKLSTALDENAGLHEQLLVQAREAGVFDERQRMAREIHDTLAQGLTGIITQLQAAERATDEEGRQRHLGQVHALAKDSLMEARRSVQALRPEPLVESRLPEAVSELGRRWSETSGVPIKIEVTGDTRPLPPELEVTLFRVTQEALANAGKHAKASLVGLTLSYSDDIVMLDVRDDGVGFDPLCAKEEPTDGTGYGMQAMRQRLGRVAGTLTIESAPGEGTAVNAQVPAGER